MTEVVALCLANDAIQKCGQCGIQETVAGFRWSVSAYALSTVLCFE